MTIDLQTCRQTLLHDILAIKAFAPAAQLHLLYTPEQHDPLDLSADTRRETALIHPQGHSKAKASGKQSAPRLLTMDCRRVAAYLLDSDPALDDPAFEASITQSYAETCLARTHDADLTNDERESSPFAVGGWLVSADNAYILAQRLQAFSLQHRSWVRWTNPIFLSALWPTMTDEQRLTMLGDAIWLAFDATGTVRRYAAHAHNAGGFQNSPAALHQDSTKITFTSTTVNPRLNDRQRQMIRNVPLVRDLIPGWQSLCEEQGRKLPANAEQQLHAHVIAAQQAGLDAESVAVYAMTVVQLKHGATDDAEWVQLVRHAAHHGMLLRDMLDKLSDAFWDRYHLSDGEDGNG